MKKSIVVIFISLSIYGCGTNKELPPGRGGAQNGSPQDQKNCVKSHPALSTKEFISMQMAVAAFARVQIDCNSSKKQLTDFAEELERQ